jgi:nuclear transport factor 2 (NTF2) superfamily protein
MLSTTILGRISQAMLAKKIKTQAGGNVKLRCFVSKLVVAAVLMALLVLSGCESGGSPMSLSKVREFALSYTEAWSSQDPASVAAHYSESGSLQINDNEPSVGRDQLEATARSFMNELPDLVLTMDDLSYDGERYNYRWTLDGSNTGPGGTGNTVHISGYEEWTLGPDGLIQRSQGHMDLNDYARQLAGESP